MLNLILVDYIWLLTHWLQICLNVIDATFGAGFPQQGEGHQKSTPLCLIFRGSTVNNRQEASEISM